MIKRLALNFLLGFLLLLGITSQAAAAAPKSTYYNGRIYYVVNGQDPSQDTGNKVCSLVGKKCVGYTAYTTDVCKLFHPTASATTSVNGSKAGFYCDGAPQKGLACENAKNNCQVCPACNVNMNCDSPIGGLFREMYVECSGAPEPRAAFQTGVRLQTVDDLISYLLNNKDAINQSMPGALKNILGTNEIQLFITSPQGTDMFWISTQGGLIDQVGRGRLLFPRPTMRISTSSATIQGILGAADPISALLAAIRSGAIQINYVGFSFQNLFLRLGVGAARLGLFGNAGAIPSAPRVLNVTDTTGKDTSCNVKWNGPKKIACDGVFQAPNTGYGSNCCQDACGADRACDEYAPGNIPGGSCNSACRFSNRPVAAPPVSLNQPQNYTDPRIGSYPGDVACEFYQNTLPGDPVKSNKTLVHPCAGPRVAGLTPADRFCVIAMDSQYARAAKCEDHGIIVCTNPCHPPTYQLPVPRCAFDNDRPRGYNAPPISFCQGAAPGAVSSGQPTTGGKKNPGEICQHGGECRTGNCVGDGPPYGYIYRCSCNPFRLEYSGC